MQLRLKFDKHLLATAICCRIRIPITNENDAGTSACYVTFLSSSIPGQIGLLMKDILVVHSVEEKRTWIEGWPLLNTRLEYASSVEDIRSKIKIVNVALRYGHSIDSKFFFLNQEIERSRFSFVSSLHQALLCLVLAEHFHQGNRLTIVFSSSPGACQLV